MAYKFDKVRIVVIDDMQPMLDLVKSVLTIYGFNEIYIATNGEDGFQAICKHDPDLVITDWMMSPVDGLKLADMVRRNPMTPNPYVPILMMTGFSSRLRVENARDSGITEFLVKPFNSKDLYRRVAQIIENPRQFVDTGKFFGPDRRRRSDDDYEGPRRRDREQENKTESPVDEEKFSGILNKLREDARKI